MREVAAGNLRAAEFALTHQSLGRGRGWSQRQEIVGEAGGPLKVVVEFVDPEDHADPDG
jgi:hypothetical protein